MPTEGCRINILDFEKVVKSEFDKRGLTVDDEVVLKLARIAKLGVLKELGTGMIVRTGVVSVASAKTVAGYLTKECEVTAPFNATLPQLDAALFYTCLHHRLPPAPDVCKKKRSPF